jgi:hypothetical protein
MGSFINWIRWNWPPLVFTFVACSMAACTIIVTHTPLYLTRTQICKIQGGHIAEMGIIENRRYGGEITKCMRDGIELEMPTELIPRRDYLKELEKLNEEEGLY